VSEVDKMMGDNRPMDEIAYEAMTSEVQPSGKTYPVYKTEDGRLELRMCYDTATAYLLSEGRLSSKQELTTIEELAHMVRNLETYDAKLRRASI
jgi:hypothetical protein